jgi:hypothetical protein
MAWARRARLDRCAEAFSSSSSGVPKAMSTALEAAGRLDPPRAWTVGNERQLTGIAIG